jgi:hypothetical protein
MVVDADTLPTIFRNHIAPTLQDELNVDKQRRSDPKKGRAFTADRIFWCKGIGNHDPERLADSMSLADSRYGSPRDPFSNNRSESMVMAV